MICILFVCIGIGTGLMTLAYLIPVNIMEPHIRETQTVFIEEGAYPELSKYCSSRLDNWSEANMILSAIYDGPERTLEKAMNICQYRIENNSKPVESLMAYFGVSVNEKVISPWTRYWCGFLVFLKPLFALMSYKTIRTVNLIFQTSINVVLVYYWSTSSGMKAVSTVYCPFEAGGCPCPAGTGSSQNTVRSFPFPSNRRGVL